MEIVLRTGQSNLTLLSSVRETHPLATIALTQPYFIWTLKFLVPVTVEIVPIFVHRLTISLVLFGIVGTSLLPSFIGFT